jgi:hypothetical protein
MKFALNAGFKMNCARKLFWMNIIIHWWIVQEDSLMNCERKLFWMNGHSLMNCARNLF